MLLGTPLGMREMGVNKTPNLALNIGANPAESEYSGSETCVSLTEPLSASHPLILSSEGLRFSYF